MARNVEEVESLEQQVREQADEIQRLKRELSEASDRVSRRGIVKGLGLGSLLALGAAGAALGGGQTVQAAPPGVQASGDLAGDLPVRLALKIQGSVVQGEGTDGSIECIYFDSSVKSPRDAASGQATGRRQYAPIIIRKRIDKTTPLLAKALGNNELIEGLFQFYRTGQGGLRNEPFFTIAITGGNVIERQLYVPETFKTGAESAVPPLEEVAFTFQRITWTFVNGGVTFEDTLSSQA